MSLIERLRRRWGTSDDQHEADALRSRSDALGVVAIAQAQDRALVEVSGVARSLTHPPRGGGPIELVVELYDGSGSVDVVWLGRRDVPGIHPGVHLRVRGRIGMRGRTRTMFNPRYAIVPSS